MVTLAFCGVTIYFMKAGLDSMILKGHRVVGRLYKECMQRKRRKVGSEGLPQEKNLRSRL